MRLTRSSSTVPTICFPNAKSERVYVLLREALKATGKVGIATFVLRSREYLAAIRPRGAALVLDTMHFCAELRPMEKMPAGRCETGEA